MSPVLGLRGRHRQRGASPEKGWKGDQGIEAPGIHKEKLRELGLLSLGDRRLKADKYLLGAVVKPEAGSAQRCAVRGKEAMDTVNFNTPKHGFALHCTCGWPRGAGDSLSLGAFQSWLNTALSKLL